MSAKSTQVWPVVGEYHEGRQVYIKCRVALLKAGASIEALYYCDADGNEINYQPQPEDVNFDFAR